LVLTDFKLVRTDSYIGAHRKLYWCAPISNWRAPIAKLVLTDYKMVLTDSDASIECNYCYILAIFLVVQDVVAAVPCHCTGRRFFFIYSRTGQLYMAFCGGL
jgi:hypothetical protein